MKYTYERSEDLGYNIYDPDGILICWVFKRTEAQGLISHLNRE